jgi:hypothetical protein
MIELEVFILLNVALILWLISQLAHLSSYDIVQYDSFFQSFLMI